MDLVEFAGLNERGIVVEKKDEPDSVYGGLAMETNLVRGGLLGEYFKPGEDPKRQELISESNKLLYK
jgi:hypothetical protein